MCVQPPSVFSAQSAGGTNKYTICQRSHLLDEDPVNKRKMFTSTVPSQPVISCNLDGCNI